jgi:hypothetical protein
MMEAGGVGYSGLLKTRKLLISRPAKNAKYHEIALNWNVSGTRDFHLSEIRVVFQITHIARWLPDASGHLRPQSPFAGLANSG